jgi:ABC-type xylose transport system substrate-binding protein
MRLIVTGSGIVAFSATGYAAYPNINVTYQADRGNLANKTILSETQKQIWSKPIALGGASSVNLALIVMNGRNVGHKARYRHRAKHRAKTPNNHLPGMTWKPKHKRYHVGKPHKALPGMDWKRRR